MKTILIASALLAFSAGSVAEEYEVAPGMQRCVVSLSTTLSLEMQSLFLPRTLLAAARLGAHPIIIYSVEAIMDSSRLVALGELEEDVLVYHLHDCLILKEMTVACTNQWLHDQLQLTEYTLSYQADRDLLTVTYVSVLDEDDLLNGVDVSTTTEVWSTYVSELPHLNRIRKQNLEASNGT